VTVRSRFSDRGRARPPGTGRRAWWVLAGMVRVVGRILRGLIAAAVLLALVAGLPWALWHYIGWPLPDHVPTWAELEAVLLGPMTTTFLLDVLACLCWITWIAFTLDVLGCTVNVARDGVEAVRLRDFSVAGPLHALAGVLVGGVVLAVLGNRPLPAPATSPSTALGTGTGIVATAPALPLSKHGVETTLHGTGVTRASAVSAASPVPGTAPARPESVVVRAPENGVHDSLWRIAHRTLGDGARWPEIFELNKGKPQHHGHRLTQPSLIFPGEELALPADAATLAPQPPPESLSPPPAPPEPTTAPPATSPPGTSTAAPSRAHPAGPAAPAPSTQPAPPAVTGPTNSPPPVTREPGFRWGPELFVGLGLATAVSAALVIARRRHNSRYRPGSGDRTEFPVAPVVYQLRLAHLRAEADDDGEFDLDGPDENVHPDFSTPASSSEDERSRRIPPQVPPPPALIVGAPDTGTEVDAAQWPALAAGMGVRDGREIALNLAAAHGLGLVGAGAAAAVRALLVAALTTSPGRAGTPSPTGPTGSSVLVPADDLGGLLGREHAHLPAALRVVAGLGDALDELEAETLVRAGASREHNIPPRSWPPLVLVARPQEHQRQRLQAVLDNGAPFGITGLLLGQWQPGVTCYVRADGTISATGPGLGEALRGTQVFRLGDHDTVELLTLLQHAEPTTPRDPHTDDQRQSTTRPRIVAADPNAGVDCHGEPADDTGDTALEVTAAVQAPDPTVTELEILGSSPPTTPGVRPPPPDFPRPQPAAPRAPESTAPHGASDEAGAEADDSVSAGEHSTTAPDPSPDATAVDRADTPAATAPAPITITVLGPLRVHWNPHPAPSSTGTEQQGREITGTLQPRTQELLVLLALHPDGITREALVAALWGEDPPARPTNALHTALSRMRRAVADATDQTVTGIAVVGNGRYQLDPTTVTVDYWRFATAVATRRTAPTSQQRIAAYREVVNTYGGPLADGMTGEWIGPAREAIRRDAIDAVSALARALGETDPAQTLELLEVARAFDPHNEMLYRDIMRLQERLGQLDAIPRTLTLLTTRLAEIDEAPTPQARGLAARLGQRRDTTREDTTGSTPTAAARLASTRERGRSAAS
jgi:DNA-binding SARP family transcriptional activator